MTHPPGRRRLVLLRHARAEHHGGISDELRPLNPTGRRQAVEVGRSFVAGRLVPDVVLCSSAVRTRQTFELLASAFGSHPDVEFTEDLYGAGISSTLDLIGAARETAGTVLVVGHEPVMSGVAYVLAGPGSDESAVARVRAGVPTGAYCVLEHETSWRRLERGGAVLTHVYLPPHHA